MDFVIAGGNVLMPGGAVERVDLTISAGNIVAVGESGSATSRRWRADGLMVLPGMIDLHGDAFERQLMPRPGVRFADDMALFDTDRQLVANGITTAYHGLTYSWEPGLRDADSARRFVNGLRQLRPRLSCDTRLHLRFETFNLDAVDEVIAWIEDGLVDLLAFNDHTDDIAAKLTDRHKLATYAARTGLTGDDFAEMLRQTKARSPEVPAAMQRLSDAARAASLPMASHDDISPEMRAEYLALG